MMRDIDRSREKWPRGDHPLLYFMELDIAVVGIELARHKARELTLSRKEEAYLSSIIYDFKAKCRMRLRSPKSPPLSFMFDRMMEGREHFTCDEDTLLIGSIDRNLIGDDALMERHLIFSIVSDFPDFSKDFILPFAQVSLYCGLCHVKTRKYPRISLPYSTNERKKKWRSS